jgi:hypothetical protein
MVSGHPSSALEDKLANLLSRDYTVFKMALSRGLLIDYLLIILEMINSH